MFTTNHSFFRVAEWHYDEHRDAGFMDSVLDTEHNAPPILGAFLTPAMFENMTIVNNVQELAAHIITLRG